MTRYFMIALLALVLCPAAGCGKRREPVTTYVIDDQPAEFVLMVAVDMSGSFSKLLAEDGKAYEFLLRALHKYDRAGIGGDYRIVITQLSGNDRPLLWEGSPRDLHTRFGSPEEFRDFLLTQADTASSRINDGVTESLDYVLYSRSVSNSDARLVALVLSDMIENHDTDGESIHRLTEALSRFSDRGKLGFYYCDQVMLPEMRSVLSRAGVKDYILESSINTNPPLPSFD